MGVLSFDFLLLTQRLQGKKNQGVIVEKRDNGLIEMTETSTELRKTTIRKHSFVVTQ